MSQHDTTFDQRVRRVERRYRQILARGGVTKMGDDGLVTLRPRRATPKFPVRALFILLAVAFAFKVFMFVWLGAAEYDARVARLQDGTVIEQGGAWVMQADPATVWISEQIARVAF